MCIRDSFSSSSLFFCDSTGTKVFRLPETMDGDFAAPEPFSRRM